MPELAKTYKPSDVEPAILDRWNDAKAFHADPAESPAKPPYCVLIPPPNVTAALHMGHALNNTLQDILIRWRRMAGDNAVWIPGTDHAGIATQTVVEKRVLAEQGKKRTDFEREDFVKLIQAWKDEYEATITNQLKTMGCSCDWDRQRFTMDPVCAKAVREAFFQLFKDGLIYRGKRLVNWDPATQTALADDEVEMEEINGQFYYLKYPLADGSGHVTVATTRPETMLGDTAVAVNPKDPRAAGLRGKKVLLPIVNRVIPIIEDDYVVLSLEHGGPADDVKAQFATGFLKVTPAHDDNDYLLGQRHKLPLINVLAPDATISKDHGWPAEDFAAGDEFLARSLVGKDRFVARKMVVKWFEEHGLLEGKKPYRHSVGHSYRSHVPIEPYLSDQWYVKVTDPRLAGAALKALHKAADGIGGHLCDTTTAGAEPRMPSSALWEGQLHITPERYAKTYQAWHENIRDWCISRQLWWGHRIPVWTITIDMQNPWFKQFMSSGLRRPTVHGIVTAELEKLFFPLQEQSEEAPIDEVKLDPICWEPGLVLGTDRHERELGVGQDQSAVIHLCTRTPEADAILEQFALEVERRKQGKMVLSRFEVAATYLESIERDPDVLDTWFSSALWPISTLGWPDPTKFPTEFPEGDAALTTWNPSHTLSTAREILTLWVSRMVMFNLYFRGCLPFTEVFIHAMIQDGHGQKMSKTLGNGVDPLDIIHSHGSDAMRFTLAKMTTNTQDVRMPVEMVCPHHPDEVVTPKTIVAPGGYTVPAPIQQCSRDAKLQMVSSYGLSSGQAEPTDAMPVARNTSDKFDEGRNFTNKLWNAVRFALGNLESEASRDVSSGGAPGSRSDPAMSLPDRWILSRLGGAIAAADKSLSEYEFSNYAQGLYDFIWRDLCDWYIEAVKPTVKTDAGQRHVLACCLDATLRLLHPVMPFVTERLWEALNEVMPERAVAALALPASPLLIHALWPKASPSLTDAVAEAEFGLLQAVISALREVRTPYKVPPKQNVTISIKAPADLAQKILAGQTLIETLANVTINAMGPQVAKPADAAATVAAGMELYLHGLIEAGAEKTRFTKRLDELTKSIATLQGRLGNKSYTDRAPAHLVQQTRDQLATAEREAETIRQQLTTLA